MKKYFFTMIIALFLFACDNSETNVENPDDFSGNSGTFIDERDNNEYKWIKIGDQIWMAENLKATKYNDGSAIPNVTENESWESLTTAAYCWYNNDATTNGNIYGALYNWYAVNSGKLAPKGWHVPTHDEWIILENSLIVNGYNYDASTSENKIAKSMAAKTNWLLSTNVGTPGMDLPSNNKSGFSALPGGERSYHTSSFNSIGSAGYWWTSTIGNPSTYVYNRYISNSAIDLDFLTFTINMADGRSIRCIKD